LNIKKHKIVISNTGYTGSPGYEIYLDNNIIVEIWDLLLNHGKKYNLCPVGLGARDTLRI
jgi:aminomethyltransferase